MFFYWFKIDLILGTDENKNYVALTREATVRVQLERMQRNIWNSENPRNESTSLSLLIPAQIASV